jgi:hypothetical protein
MTLVSRASRVVMIIWGSVRRPSLREARTSQSSETESRRSLAMRQERSWDFESWWPSSRTMAGTWVSRW